MRILVLLLMFFFGFSVATANAQPLTVEKAQDSVEGLRTGARALLLQSRDLLVSGLGEVQKATGLNNEQLYGVGVGAVVGLLIADWAGPGSLATLAVVGAGAVVGNWIASK